MTTLKAPAEKLPLTVRKNVRDKWESKKGEFESTISGLLGETWTIEVNPNLIYVYAGDDYKDRVGTIIIWYIEPFINHLKTFVKGFGADGVQELNSCCPKHQLVFAPQEKTNFNYGGLVVEDGALRLVFNQNTLCSNVDDVSRDFAGALAKAPAPSNGGSAYNLTARNAVRADYDSKIEDLRSEIAKLVNIPDLKLNGNFEANATELAKTAKQQGWEPRIGWITLAYFETLKNALRREKFAEDDMQQEAFQEAVEKGEICVQALPKWEDGKSRYNRLKIDDGVLYIQTTTELWDVNIDDAAQGLLDIL